MLTIVVYVVVTLIVAAGLFALSIVVFGRGELLPPVSGGHTVTALPEGPIAGEDVRSVRFAMAPRGYTMSQVDWVLEQAAEEIDSLRARLRDVDGDTEPSHGVSGEAATASQDGPTR